MSSRTPLRPLEGYGQVYNKREKTLVCFISRASGSRLILYSNELCWHVLKFWRATSDATGEVI